MSNKKSSIPFVDFGGQGKTIHFAHANGYPPGGYRQFIQPFLTNHKVIASLYRPLWGGRSPSEVKDWTIYADDLIRFMEEKGLKNVIGMGHSMGGTITCIAAIKRPDLFQQLVLLDPVIFSFKASLLTNFLPNSLLKRVVPIAKTAMRRKDQWASREEVYSSWRTKKVFKRLSDSVLKDFIHHAVVPDNKGNFTLAFSKEWETQVYVTAPYIFGKLLQLKMPITVVKAEKHSVLQAGLWAKWQKEQPTTKFLEYKDSGHLIPMEHPSDLANLLIQSIST